MGEYILPDLGIQEALTGNQGIHGAQEHAHIFPAQRCRQTLQKHPLYMGLFFVREERDIPCHHRNGDNCLHAMRLSILCSQRFSQGENGFRNFDGRTCLRRRGANLGVRDGLLCRFATFLVCFD